MIYNNIPVGPGGIHIPPILPAIGYDYIPNSQDTFLIILISLFAV